MIKLTLRNGNDILINIDSIKRIEWENPTSIILNNGDTINVTESPLTVTNLIKDYESVKKISDQ